MRRLTWLAATCLTLLAAVTESNTAHAGGMYYSERGVRPLGRGGAFVAGADDLGAITYNPAGIADAGSALLIDAAWVNVTTDYTRKAYVADSAGNNILITYPKVQGTTPFLPIPTLAGSFQLPGAANMFTVAAGVYAPYAALSKFPVTLSDGQPSPSRYSLVSLEGSALAVIGAYVAFKPIEQFRLGVGFEALVGELSTDLVFSASPQDRLLSAPESPEYDSRSKLKTKPFFAPSGHFGMTVVPIKEVRFGLAFHLPYNVDAPAELNVQLPRASTFDNARQEGKDVRVRTTLPAVLRAGVEGRFTEDLRVELSYVREFWVSHNEIAIDPGNVQFYGVTGFPSPFPIPPVSIPRNFRSSNSFRLGGEYSVLKPPHNTFGLDVRAGVGYETSAVPNDYLTPLTADLPRLTLAVGASIKLAKKWRLDAMYAHVFGFEQEADPATAAVPPVNPVRGNPTTPVPINAGTYDNDANIIGLGATVQF